MIESVTEALARPWVLELQFSSVLESEMIWLPRAELGLLVTTRKSFSYVCIVIVDKFMFPCFDIMVG